MVLDRQWSMVLGRSVGAGAWTAGCGGLHGGLHVRLLVYPFGGPSDLFAPPDLSAPSEPSSAPVSLSFALSMLQPWVKIVLWR